MASTVSALTQSSAEAPQMVAKEAASAVATNGAIALLGTLLAQGFSVVTTLWIARTLGADAYGVFVLAQSIINIALPLVALGLPTTVIRFLPVHIAKQQMTMVKGILYSSTIISGITGVVGALVVFYAAPIIAMQIFREPRLIMPLRYLAPLILFISLAELFKAILRSLKVTKYDATINVLRPTIQLGGWSILLNTTISHLNAATFSYMLGNIAGLFAGAVYINQNFRKVFVEKTEWCFSLLIRYSLPIISSSFLYAIAPRIDRFMLGTQVDSQAVGVYSVAASLAIYVNFFHSSIVTAFTPMIADTFHRVSVEEAKGLYIKVTEWDAQLTLSIVFTLILFGQDILGFIGNEFSNAFFPLALLSISMYISTLTGPSGPFLTMTNHQKIEALNALFMVVITVIFQFLLGWQWGMIGVAVGFLLSAVLLNIIQIIEIVWLYNFSPFSFPYLVFCVVSTLGLGAVTYMAGQAALDIRILAFSIISALYLIYMYIRYRIEFWNIYNKTNLWVGKFLRKS